MWPDEPGVAGKEIVRIAERTDLALVYLHGFSGSKWEIDPVHRRVAQRLGANLFLTRFAGHGMDGEALAGASPAAWLADMEEAVAVGRNLGRRVVLIGTSTGGLLAAHAAARGMADGVVLISPNFALNPKVAWLFRLPQIRRWGPHVFGQTRTLATAEDPQKQYWTASYPTRALWPLIDLMRMPLDVGRARCPALFLWSEGDRVISPRAVRRAARLWGGPVTRVPLMPEPGDDPMRHVLAGDMLSPGMNDRVTDLIVDWISREGPAAP
ncbi:alpha/beta hydrolase [Falsirhodobacter sp. 1013]|uniref:alpha/beta hydrolase n=1 Tax=Falsirhodobacter sp. 1013 TaxID=3417566 RepID=UPI003EC0615A